MGFNSESQWEIFGECECGATVWEMNGKFNCPDCICGRDLEDDYARLQDAGQGIFSPGRLDKTGRDNNGQD